MLSEVIIHLGNEWRDLGLLLFGIFLGSFLGYAICENNITKARKKGQD